jgi:hypothetical protein
MLLDVGALKNTTEANQWDILVIRQEIEIL